MTRPATVIAVLLVVPLHALVLTGGSLGSGTAAAAFVLTHPGFGPSLSFWLSTVLGALFNLVLSVGDVLLGVRVWNAAPRSRTLLTVWLGLSGVISLGGVVTSLALTTPSALFSTLAVVEVALCAAAVVLLWRSPTTAWLRGSSVRPARPAL